MTVIDYREDRMVIVIPKLRVICSDEHSNREVISFPIDIDYFTK